MNEIVVWAETDLETFPIAATMDNDISHELALSTHPFINALIISRLNCSFYVSMYHKSICIKIVIVSCIFDAIVVI